MNCLILVLTMNNTEEVTFKLDYATIPVENTSTSEDYRSSLALRIAEGTTLLAIFLVSVVGNCALWLIVCLSPTLRTLSNALLLCLSTADILVSLSNMPMTVYTILIGEWLFSATACTVQGFVNMTSFIASVMCLAAISWNRYIAICKPTCLHVYFSRRNTAIIIAAVWGVSVILASPPLLGWGKYAYLSRQSFCFCDWPTSVSYTFFMVFTCFGIPCLSMTLCYIRIFKEVRASRRRIANFDPTKSSKNTESTEQNISDPGLLSPRSATTETYANGRRPPAAAFVTSARETKHIRVFIQPVKQASFESNGTLNNNAKTTEKSPAPAASTKSTYQQTQERKRLREEHRLVFSLLIVVLIFIVAWLPFCVTMFWSVFSKSNPPPRSVDMFSLLLGYANSCCNPIVYGIMNKRFNEAFKRVFKCQCARVSRVAPVDGTST